MSGENKIKMKNNVANISKQINYCTSCQLCSAVCPTNAIKIELTQDGFYEPIIEENKCINCAKCMKFCYKYDLSVEMNDELKDMYAAKANDKDLLFKSTSGGIGSILAEQLIADGYKIVGVTYNYELHRAETIVIDKISDINRIQGSKYIQSYSEECYKQIIGTLKNDKYAIFGLPCQIYAINKYLNFINRRDEFILVDLFCHGCPSITLWKKYIENIKKKNKMSSINKIEFRSKVKGWHEFIIHIKDINNKKFVSKNANEGFYRLFFSDKILNNACYNCKLRSTLNYTDIRLGDYWGSNYDLDKEGVSGVAIVTQKGSEIFNKVKDKLWYLEEDFQNFIQAQSYGKNYDLNVETRKKVFEIINNCDDFSEILKRYNKLLSKKEKIKSYIKAYFYLLPKNLRRLIKKIVR